MEVAPAAGNSDEDETMDVDLRGDEDDDDMDLGMIDRRDHCSHWYHQDVWNEFASQESCMEVGSKATMFSEMFGGMKFLKKSMMSCLVCLWIISKLLKG